MNHYPEWLQRLALPELSPVIAALEVAARSINSADDLAEFIRDQDGLIRRQGLTGTAAAARHSDVMDTALRRLLSMACAAQHRSDAEEDVSDLAIIATGGYGRRELAPYSDVDVTFVPAREDDPETDGLVRCLFKMMMDSLMRKAGKKIGYAYRVISDCGSLEMQTQTSLIDARFIAGDYRLFRAFKDELRKQIDPAHFLFDRVWERLAERENAGGTVYRLEPDLKNGPGGLRDIQTAMWMAQVRFGVWSSAVWEELIDRDVVSFRQVERLYDSLEFIHTLRNILHWRAGKQNDVLLMAQQQEVADQLGFASTADRTASQQLMAAYFSHAEQVAAVAHRVVSWCLESRLELGLGLAVVRRHIECTVPVLFLSMPSNLVKVFSLSQVLRVPLSSELESMILETVQSPRGPKPDDVCGPMLLGILEASEGVSATLGAMAQVGVLGWMIPEFAPLMNLAPRNSAHEFSVGYHSLETVRRLEQIRDDNTPSVYGEAFSQLDYVAPLYLAGLLHDSGKQDPSGDHSVTGAGMVESVAERLGFAPQHIARAQLLVRHHLLMAEIAHYRDLTRDDSVRELLDVVDNQETLDQLFLLTQADGASVGNSVWTPLQSRFLEQLYHRATQMLANPTVDPGEVDLRRYQRRVTMALSGHNLSPEDVARHVELMPASYLLNTPPDVMAMHIGQVRLVNASGKPAIQFRDDRVGQFCEIAICALDDPQPGLLSKVAGCLWAADLSVHSAQVFTREGDIRIAIDTVLVDYHGHPPDVSQKRRVENDLVNVLTGSTDVRQLLISRGKQVDLDAPIHDPEILGRCTEDHMIFEVRTPDQKGLLFRLTRAIAGLGWNIQSARINSSAGRTRDVFYVGGVSHLAGEEACHLLRERLQASAIA